MIEEAVMLRYEEMVESARREAEPRARRQADARALLEASRGQVEGQRRLVPIRRERGA